MEFKCNKQKDETLLLTSLISGSDSSKIVFTTITSQEQLEIQLPSGPAHFRFQLSSIGTQQMQAKYTWILNFKIHAFNSLFCSSCTVVVSFEIVLDWNLSLDNNY